MKNPETPIQKCAHVAPCHALACDDTAKQQDPINVARKIGLPMPVILSTELEGFLRNPGPGDATFRLGVLYEHGGFEPVGCVGDTYENRLYDTIVMLNANLLALGRIRTRLLQYALRLNGLIVNIHAVRAADGVLLSLPRERTQPEPNGWLAGPERWAA